MINVFFFVLFFLKTGAHKQDHTVVM